MHSHTHSSYVKYSIAHKPPSRLTVAQAAYTSEAHAHPGSDLNYDDEGFPKESYLHGLKRAGYGIAAMCFFGKYGDVVVLEMAI